MNFENLLMNAKLGDALASEEILNIYKPLLIKNSIVRNVFDEDLYQELCIVLLECIQKFNIN